jgi:hypothetical protein
MNLSILVKADISKTEFAKIMRTSRTTVHSWMNGGGIHSMVSTRLRRTLNVIETAVNTGDLPLNRDVPRKERLDAIVYALKKHNVQPPVV